MGQLYVHQFLILTATTTTMNSSITTTITTLKMQIIRISQPGFEGMYEMFQDL